MKRSKPDGITPPGGCDECLKGVNPRNKPASVGCKEKGCLFRMCGQCAVACAKCEEVKCETHRFGCNECGFTFCMQCEMQSAGCDEWCTECFDKHSKSLDPNYEPISTSRCAGCNWIWLSTELKPCRCCSRQLFCIGCLTREDSEKECEDCFLLCNRWPDMYWHKCGMCDTGIPFPDESVEANGRRTCFMCLSCANGVLSWRFFQQKGHKKFCSCPSCMVVCKQKKKTQIKK